MKKFINIIFLVLFVSSCEQEEIEPTLLNYFPLAVGNQWIFEVSDKSNVITYDTLRIDSMFYIDNIKTHRLLLKNFNSSTNDVDINGYIFGELGTSLYSKNLDPFDIWTSYELPNAEDVSKKFKLIHSNIDYKEYYWYIKGSVYLPVITNTGLKFALINKEDFKSSKLNYSKSELFELDNVLLNTLEMSYKSISNLHIDESSSLSDSRFSKMPGYTYKNNDKSLYGANKIEMTIKYVENVGIKEIVRKEFDGFDNYTTKKFKLVSYKLN